MSTRADENSVAIVGIACRLPGVRGPSQLLESLESGYDAVSTDLDDRARGVGLEEAACLADVDRFDASFFRISPREAAAMDPQQRLLLEVAWHALEDARIPADSLRRSRTGVYLGISGSGYSLRLLEGLDDAGPAELTGTLTSIASNRISYFFDFEGPSMSIDTACSSSLVATQVACSALRAGDADLALVGGVNIILDRFTTGALDAAGVLAPDGRCKTFDAAANGYGRGEGVIMLVLRRLEDAVKRGDRIYGSICSAVVNSDGASNGLMAPNRASQESLLRRAYERCGISPADVQYVEAHGTGTLLGDPIETKALARVLGKNRREPLAIGSVKTNFGHLEAAAGALGLAKAALMLHHESLLPSIHYSAPNPYIRFDRVPLRVQDKRQAWPRGGARRVAGVSSFGIGGTNAHAVLIEAPQIPPPLPRRNPRAAQVVCVGAASKRSLRENAGRLAEWVAAHPDALEDIAYSTISTRASFPHRASVASLSAEAMTKGLRGIAAGTAASSVARGDPPRVAFAFTGQGSQYRAMARGLYESEPAFAAALDVAAKSFRRHTDTSLLETLSDDRISDTQFTQPAMVAVGWAMASMFEAWGVRPSVVLGHSVGEITAACVANMFPIDGAIAIAAARGKGMAACPRGAMLATGLDEAGALELVAPDDELAIAGVNLPRQIVLSGSEAAIARAQKILERRGVRAKRLSVSCAFHSPLIEPMLDAFEVVAARVGAQDDDAPSGGEDATLELILAAHPRAGEAAARDLISWAVRCDITPAARGADQLWLDITARP